MAFTIGTFGPFSIDFSTEPINKTSFWDEVEEARKGLSKSFGIYIFATNEKATRQPWYVGKTESSFHTRFGSHFRTEKILKKIKKECPGAKVEILFIAFTTPKRDGIAKITASRKSWLEYLETAMIGACMAANPKMLNNKKTLLLKKVAVPGFLGDNPQKRDESAKALAALLKAC